MCVVIDVGEGLLTESLRAYDMTDIILHVNNGFIQLHLIQSLCVTWHLISCKYIFNSVRLQFGHIGVMVVNYIFSFSYITQNFTLMVR